MTPAKLFWLLKKPFRPEEISYRKGPGGKELAYINARDVMKRLDDVVGGENWQRTFRPCGSSRVTCDLSIRVGGEWITKSDGAGETQIEGEKGIFSDAFKRAGAAWGIGRHLYYDKQITPEQYEKLLPCPD